MKANTGKTNEKQPILKRGNSNKPGPSARATIEDNRPRTVYQRKLQHAMDAHVAARAAPIQQKPAYGSPRFRQIATDMGAKYGVDTSGLKATHNSSLPAKLHAEATIQGNNIHFAAGKDTDYNIRHEVAHAIDNTLYGTPKGDQVVNGQKVDTTREKVVDRMAKGMRPITKIAKKESERNDNGLVQLKLTDRFSKKLKRTMTMKKPNIRINYNLGNIKLNDDRIKSIEVAKKMIDTYRFIAFNMGRDPIETALHPRTLKLLRKAMRKFISKEYDLLDAGLSKRYIRRRVKEETRKEQFGREGGCEAISILWSYIINRIEGQEIAQPIPKWVGGANYHVAVRIQGYGEVDASYRQFSNDPEVANLPFATSIRGTLLPSTKNGYSEMIYGMLNRR